MLIINSPRSQKKNLVYFIYINFSFPPRVKLITEAHTD
jgi:hypothetical protein